MEDTFARHTRDGEFSPERLLVHGRIIEEALSGLPSRDHPEIIFMAGGPASGKSRLREALPSPPAAVVVDPDLIRASLPEYDEYVAAGRRDAAVLTHREARRIAPQLTALAQVRRLNLILDAVGGNDQNQFTDKIEAAIGIGYAATVRYATVPVDTALAREAERAAESGRVVPRELILAKHAEVSRGFVAVTKLPVRTIQVFETSEDEPLLIAEGPGGKGPEGLRLLDPASYDLFLKKGEQ